MDSERAVCRGRCENLSVDSLLYACKCTLPIHEDCLRTERMKTTSDKCPRCFHTYTVVQRTRFQEKMDECAAFYLAFKVDIVVLSLIFLYNATSNWLGVPDADMYLVQHLFLYIHFAGFPTHLRRHPDLYDRNLLRVFYLSFRYLPDGLLEYMQEKKEHKASLLRERRVQTDVVLQVDFRSKRNGNTLCTGNPSNIMLVDCAHNPPKIMLVD